jgi:hypothetical protein
MRVVVDVTGKCLKYTLLAAYVFSHVTPESGFEIRWMTWRAFLTCHHQERLARGLLRRQDRLHPLRPRRVFPRQGLTLVHFSAQACAVSDTNNPKYPLISPNTS